MNASYADTTVECRLHACLGDAPLVIHFTTQAPPLINIHDEFINLRAVYNRVSVADDGRVAEYLFAGFA